MASSDDGNIQKHARQLRRAFTNEERLLWYQLRSRRFACYKFRRQPPVVRYILNFACCETRQSIGLDGGQHDESHEYDLRRTTWLNKQDWEVRWFWNNELRENEEGVLAVILEDLRRLLPSPRPSP